MPTQLKFLKTSLSRYAPPTTAYTNLGNAYFFLRRYGRSRSGLRTKRLSFRKRNFAPLVNLGDGYYWNTRGKTHPISGLHTQVITIAEEDSLVNPSNFILVWCPRHLPRDARGKKKLALDSLRRQGSSSRRPIRSWLFQAALVYNNSGSR